jgi:large subunit ribosomal protein L21
LTKILDSCIDRETDQDAGFRDQYQTTFILPYQVTGMYAIIADGGRQYKVEEGQELEIDYREISTGEELTFEKVLAVSGEEGLKLGQPTVDGASVTAQVLGPIKGEKIFVQKLRRRKNSRRRTGHRQIFTRIRISKISA